ncbi:glycine receptor subunit alpha-4-like [Pollicipes pollicipes]|uniref:glycine receptor subunit alpha-4-like n=1 Tax=Pollicipes pollicipes TaxID=41117 RepID=UPI00188517E5|nr:glycine receptor subunit alpha-4-like [Pollicipes pollicipes]
MEEFFSELNNRLSAEENVNISTCQVQPIYNVLPDNYDKFMPPFSKGRALDVQVTFWILTITQISEMRQDFTVNMYLRVYWKDFRILFPRCYLPVESYIFNGVYINLTFNSPGVYFNNFKFKIPQYTLSSVESHDCSYYHMYEGANLTHTCVQATFIFDRQFSYYFVQMYLPSILIVLVSFLSFWIPVENVPGRVALGVTSLLTLATQFTTMQRSLPPVSYMKAIDVWMFFCIVVVFLAMVEFTLAYNFKITMTVGVAV